MIGESPLRNRPGIRRQESRQFGISWDELVFPDVSHQRRTLGGALLTALGNATHAFGVILKPGDQAHDLLKRLGIAHAPSLHFEASILILALQFVASFVEGIADVRRL